MTPSADRDRMLKRLLGPAGPEVTCDECFDQLDAYVEVELAGTLRPCELSKPAEKCCPATPGASFGKRDKIVNV